MDNIANLEISPGTITITPCQRCGHDAYTFDTVALHDALPISLGHRSSRHDMPANDSGLHDGAILHMEG